MVADWSFAVLGGVVLAWFLLWITALLFLAVRHIAAKGLPKWKPRAKQKKEPKTRIRTIHDAADDIRKEYDERLRIAARIENEETRQYFVEDIEERYLRQMRDLMR